MVRAGPPLAALLRRLVDTPPHFLFEPRCGGSGIVHVAAVVHDAARRHGGEPLDAKALQAVGEQQPRSERNRLGVALVAAWLMADDAFGGSDGIRSGHDRGLGTQAVLDAVLAVAAALGGAAPAASFVTDADRREELARSLLDALGLVPEGETEAQAADRLSSVSGVQRRAVLKAGRAARERARVIREALAKKAAEEAADKWTRE